MEEVKEDQYIKDILVKIQVVDPEAFERFASEHSICFHYCPVKILDLEINRVEHHPLGR